MQADEKLYQYLEEFGCFNLVLAVLVDASAVYDCGSSGIEPDGTIVLGGYEVQAVGRSITPMDGSWKVRLYFSTENKDESQRMLELFTPGNALKAESNICSMSDGEMTLYLDGFSSVSRLPHEIEEAYRAEIQKDVE